MRGQNQIKRILFLGTGTSGSLPNITCLSKEETTCICKNYFIHPQHPDVRNNTSILVTIVDKHNGHDKNILVDCGKNFRSSILNYFSLHKIGTIDAVLLSHGHADAILGLDDLREFSVGTSIPIYLSKNCMKVVSSVFPYLVDTKKASGGGDVASLQFIQVADEDVDAANQESTENPSEIDLFGTTVGFVPVHHGFNPDGSELIAYGFKFGDYFTYISDCVKIPTQASTYINHSKIMVLDALKLTSHKSHFSLPECINEFNKHSVGFGLFVGFCHKLGHAQSLDYTSKLNLNNKQGKVIEDDSFELEMTSHDELTNFDRKQSKYTCTIKHGGPSTNRYITPAYDGLIIDFK